MPALRKRPLLSVTIATLCAATFVAPDAEAQRHLLDGQLGIGTGLEGGDPGDGGVGWKRARARIIAGLDLRVDETEHEGYGFRAFVELEKRATLGGEARYLRWFSPKVGGYLGAIGTIAPETLFGGGVGLTFLVPMGSKTSLFLEPSFSALPLGSDRAGDSVLIWGLFSAGLRAGL